MDSFNVVRIDDVSDDLHNAIHSIEPIGKEYAPIVWRSIKTAQMMNDRWQLFEMFCWNYDRYAEGLESYLDDRVVTRACCNDADFAFQRTRVDVNCFAANLISLGVTLTESLRCFMRVEVGEDDAECQCFDGRLKELFDKRGVYSLLTKLRDEAQHGQPLVSLYLDGQGGFRAAFDLDQLKRPELFSVKGILKELMEDKVVQMNELDAQRHRLSYTWCMERYFLEALKVVAFFYSCSSAHIQKTDKDLYDCIESNPAYCGELSDGRKMVCVCEGDVAHPLLGIETSGHQTHDMRQKKVESRLADAEHRFNLITAKFLSPNNESLS